MLSLKEVEKHYDGFDLQISDRSSLNICMSH